MKWIWINRFTKKSVFSTSYVQYVAAKSSALKVTFHSHVHTAMFYLLISHWRSRLNECFILLYKISGISIVCSLINIQLVNDKFLIDTLLPLIIGFLYLPSATAVWPLCDRGPSRRFGIRSNGVCVVTCSGVNRSNNLRARCTLADPRVWQDTGAEPYGPHHFLMAPQKALPLLGPVFTLKHSQWGSCL